MQKVVDKETGLTQEQSLAELARLGSVAAQETLDKKPRTPESLEYLIQWARDLHGRSGVGMGSFAPLTYTTIEAWARLNYIEITPMEVRGLLLLDNALTPTVDNSQSKKKEEEAPQARGRWPQRKTAM